MDIQAGSGWGLALSWSPSGPFQPLKLQSFALPVRGLSTSKLSRPAIALGLSVLLYYVSLYVRGHSTVLGALSRTIIVRDIQGNDPVWYR